MASNTTGQPPLALLDDAPSVQEAVSAETLEFTSRLIERKLADFGVAVRVLAAYPGPVITRYEIEPAVGVKGAQIVNLMKDLARALSVVSIRVEARHPAQDPFQGTPFEQWFGGAPGPKQRVERGMGSGEIGRAHV